MMACGPVPEDVVARDDPVGVAYGGPRLVGLGCQPARQTAGAAVPLQGVVEVVHGEFRARQQAPLPPAAAERGRLPVQQQTPRAGGREPLQSQFRLRHRHGVAGEPGSGGVTERGIAADGEVGVDAVQPFEDADPGTARLPAVGGDRAVGRMTIHDFTSYTRR
jgi:hypothetical protein